jgi:hypothetical protein
MDLVASLLAFDPAARPSAAEARLHPFLAGDGAGAASSAEGAAPATTTHIYTMQLGAAAGPLAPAAPGAAMKGPVAAHAPERRVLGRDPTGGAYSYSLGAGAGAAARGNGNCGMTRDGPDAA